MISRLLKILSRTLFAIALIGLGGFGFIFFSPRPELTIDPATLAGDGGTINYCE